MQSGNGVVGRAAVVVERPSDFESFWLELLSEVAAIPLQPSMDYLPHRSTDKVDVYEIYYSSFNDLRIAGWYCVPKESYLSPPYPALVLAPGYISEPTLPKSWARMGYAALGIAPRGKLRSNRTFNPGYPGLLSRDIVDHQSYGYRGFYLDASRGVDFLLDRSEVDSGRIGVNGSSQGGALAIVLAALRSDVVTCGAAGAPYLCGIMQAARLTHSFPYEEINEYLRQHSDHESLISQSVAYYDGLNFASMIRCPMLVYLGLEDDVCPPETGLAVYQAMECPKELITTEGCAHDAGVQWVTPRLESFLSLHLRPGVPARSGTGPTGSTVGGDRR